MLTQLKLSDSVDFTHRCYITVQSPVHTQLCICVFFYVCDRRWKWFSIESIVNCNCIYHDLSIMFHFNEFRSLKYEKIAAATQNMDKKEQHRKREKEEELCMLCCVWIDLFGEFLKRVFYHSVCVHGLKWVRDLLCTVPFHIQSLHTQIHSHTYEKRLWHFYITIFAHTHTHTPSGRFDSAKTPDKAI